MKTLTTCLAALFASALVAFGGEEWSYFAEVGEDATSTHYYFYESNGESIQRVRWVWNGGAQNAPTITEYVLGSGKITIRHLIGKRDDIAALIVGDDAELELKKEYSISTKASAEMLIPEPPDISLSEVQRVDLKNLLDLLAKERKPFKPKSQQAAPSNR
jgi:hypothetical protein